MQPSAIRHYLTEDGRDVFLEWLRRVRDQVAKAQIVLFLAGGDKGSQDADIGRAVRYWQDWNKRTQDERPGT